MDEDENPPANHPAVEPDAKHPWDATDVNHPADVNGAPPAVPTTTNRPAVQTDANHPADADGDALNFSFVSGQQRGTKLLSYNGKLYSRDKPKGKVEYYRCRKYKTCPATGYVEHGLFHLNDYTNHR